MKKLLSKKHTISIILLGIVFFQLLYFISFASGAQDAEKELVNFNLEKTDIIWEVKVSMGIFAQVNIHPHDKYKFHVYSVDGVDKKYIVNSTIAPWTTGEWDSNYNFGESDYKLIKRDWYSVARNIFAVEDANYWLTETELQQLYIIDYKDEFFMGKFINTVNIIFYFNETNYDKIKYSRSEGILLRREIKIDSINNDGQEVKGEFLIELVDYSGELEVSFWYWIFIIGIVSASVFFGLLTISILISRRQRRLKSIDY
ncbi:MAG: hypothetical protein ACTSRZ_10300 [Promethearchaeota archaeon]